MSASLADGGGLRAALERMRGILAGLPRQENEGDLSWLAAEIAEWAPARAAATRALLGDEP